MMEMMLDVRDELLMRGQMNLFEVKYFDIYEVIVYVMLDETIHVDNRMLLFDLNENLNRKMNKEHDYNEDIDRFLRSFHPGTFQMLIEYKNTSTNSFFVFEIILKYSNVLCRLVRNMFC